MKLRVVAALACLLLLPHVAAQDYAAMVKEAVGEECEPVRLAIEARVDPLIKKQAGEASALAADQARRLQEFTLSGVHTLEEMTTFEVQLQLEAQGLADRQRQEREALIRQLQTEFAGRCAALDEAAKKLPETLPVGDDPCKGREVDVAVTRALQRVEAKKQWDALSTEFVAARADVSIADDSQAFALTWFERAQDLTADFETQAASAFEAKGLTACFQHQGWQTPPLPEWREAAARIDVASHDDRPETHGDLDISWSARSRILEAEGRHVSLTLRPDLQRVEAAAVDGVVLFSSIAPDAYVPAIDADSPNGGRLLLTDEAANAWLDASDGERATLRLRTIEGTRGLELRLADHVTATAMENGYMLEAEELQARLVIHDGEHSLKGNLLHLAGSATLIGLLPDSGLPWEDAVTKPTFGAEIRLAADDGDLFADVAALGDLELSIERPRDSAVVVRVGSNDAIGRTLAFILEPGFFQRPDLLVLADDVREGNRTRPMTVRGADSLEDVLDPSNDGDVVEYWIDVGENGTRLLVSLPHFSDKRITIATVLPPLVSLPKLPAAGLVAALGALAAPVLLRRRSQ